MPILNREAILAAQDLQTQTVPVPEWGGEVIVRMMTGTERDAFGTSLLGADGKPDMANYRAKLLAATLVDEAGARLFTADDVAALGGKSAAAVERVFEVANTLNALSPAAVDTAEKN